jgi:hypothetical protein
MPSTDTKPELTAKASMAQPVSQPAVYANGLKLPRFEEGAFRQKFRIPAFFIAALNVL